MIRHLNSRRLWQRITLMAIIFAIVIWMRKMNKGPLSYLQIRPEQAPAMPRYAYATLLCDDVMAGAIKVLIYSLKKTTRYPFLLLVLPGVTRRDELIALGAEIHEISMLEYPFRVTAEKAAINKMCRYSKLHIWRFIEYQKIIFIDVDCLVVSSLDQAFKWPEFSAVRDAGDTFNTGLFVLQPSLSTWDAMRNSYFGAPSYNQGDQGFINWYFRDATKMALPVRYNTVCKHKGHAAWPLMRRQAKMIHYTSETKPWNFFTSSHKFWRQNFEAGMYYQWAKTYREVTQQMRIDAHDVKRPMWLNSKRTGEICERFYSSIENNDLLGNKMVDKLSIIFIKWKSIKSLLGAIQHYRLALESIVYRIYVSWNPSQGVLPNEFNRFKFIKEGPKVEIVTHRYESVNNIWNPIVGLATRAVFMADDEHLPDLEKMEIAYETWKNNPLSMVGFFARHHSRQKLETYDPLAGLAELDADDKATSTTDGADLQAEATSSQNSQATVTTNQQAVSIVDEMHLWLYNLTSARRPRPYSLLAAQLVLLSADHLFSYTCLLPERIHRHVDEITDDSADLAMNLLVSGMTGSRPYLVKSDFVDPEAGRFAGEAWALNRGQALKELVKLFTGGTRDPLQFNSVTVTQFNKIPFKKRSIKQWNKVN